MSGARRAVRPRRWARLVWLVALGLFVLQAALSLVLLFDHAFGTEAVSITGPSMTGTFSLGSLVFDDLGATPHVGDIVTFKAPNGTLVTHRIIGGDPTGFQTKGDANPEADPTPVPASWVIGVARFHVPLAGFGEVFLATPLGRALTYGPGLLLFLFTEISGLRRTSKDPAQSTEARHLEGASVVV